MINKQPKEKETTNVFSRFNILNAWSLMIRY